MIIFILLLIVGGAVAIIYSTADKTRGEVHFADATVVDYVASSTGVKEFDLVAKATGNGIVNAIVEIPTGSGIMRVKLYHQLPSNVSERYPELGIGGRVSVKYFGAVPKVAYLINHDLAATTVNFNPVTVGGICSVLLGIGMGILYFMME